MYGVIWSYLKVRIKQNAEGCCCTFHANNDLEKKIMEAFEVFDHSAKQVVDVREVGTILRSLGCCPTEAEVQEVILATENKEVTGNVPLHTFLPYMCKALIEHRYYPASAEMLLAAFRYFDTEGRGYLTKERFTQLMLEEGEPFTQEEFDEMMQTALDPVTDTITYEYYINQLMVEDEITENQEAPKWKSQVKIQNTH